MGRQVRRAAQGITCLINTKNTKTPAGSDVNVFFSAGTGCTATLTLFGQAFLQQTAQIRHASGNYYEHVGKSAASSGHAKVAGRPSLYTYYGANWYPFGKAAPVRIIPAPGSVFSSSSKCEEHYDPAYGTGVHCDLYSMRF